MGPGQESCRCPGAGPARAWRAPERQRQGKGGTGSRSLSNVAFSERADLLGFPPSASYRNASRTPHIHECKPLAEGRRTKKDKDGGRGSANSAPPPPPQHPDAQPASAVELDGMKLCQGGETDAYMEGGGMRGKTRGEQQEWKGQKGEGGSRG